MQMCVSCNQSITALTNKPTIRLPMKLKFIPIGLVLAAASVAHAAYTPVPLTPSSFNADVVVEKAIPALMNNTTATTDGGTNNNGSGWYEIGYNTNSPNS